MPSTLLRDSPRPGAGLAREGNWPDLVREASALRDQVQAMRNRVLNAQREVAQRATS